MVKFNWYIFFTNVITQSILHGCSLRTSLFDEFAETSCKYIDGNLFNKVQDKYKFSLRSTNPQIYIQQQLRRLDKIYKKFI